MIQLKQLFFLSVFILMLSSCTNKVSENRELPVVANDTADNAEENNAGIMSVSMTRTAGRGGSTTMTATRDSLIFEPGRRMMEEKAAFRKKISKEDWNRLIAMIDLNVLGKAKNGEGQGHYDGPDFIVHVVTKDNDYQLLNVKDAAEAKHLGDIENLLKTLIAEEK